MAGSVEDMAQIEKLVDGESFQVWNFQVIILFKAHGIFEIVNNEKIFENLTKDEEKADWTRKDARAQKIITTTIHKKFLMHIINCKNSSEMYKKLCMIFQKETEQQKCNLLQEFFNYTFQKGMDMSLNISKLENLTYRLKSLNQKIDDEMLMSKILSTLPEQYKYFYTAWESTPAVERTLTNLTSRLIGEEVRNNMKESEVAVAFKTTESNNFKRYVKKERKCYNCGKVGHFARSCTQKLQHCRICKKTNHQERDCFFRKKEKFEDKVSFLSHIQNTRDVTDFVVDSGSSTHMSNDRKMFDFLEESKSNILVAKKNESMTSEGKGNIETSNCILNNVLFVPELSKNLLSVNAITENNGEVIFSKNKVTILKDTNKILEGKKQENGLYVVKFDKKIEQSLLTQNAEKAIKWHRKLGHLGNINLKKLIDISTGIDISKMDIDKINDVCEICLQSKQTRLPFQSIRYRANRPLEILHTDICGPVERVTWDDKKYMLTILDDYTHYCVVYLLKNKNEAAGYLKEFVEEAEAYKGNRVSKIRTDNGGEFVNNEIKIWSKNKGIVMDYTIPHTPQLNGKAERLNRTLMEKARALIFDSALDNEFWGEAVRVAAYLANRSPSETVDVTPIEKWTERRPDLSRLQLFGCEAYAKVLGDTKKLKARSKRYIFIGYTLTGYRLWDEKQRKIVVYRDVIFQEKTKIAKLEIDSNVINLRELNEEVEEKHENQEQPEENQEQPEENQEQTENQEQPEENQEQTENLEQTEDQEQPIENQDLGKGNKKRDIRRPRRFDDYVMLTYEEAINGPEKINWKKAIEEEKKSLEKNNTWKYIDKKDVEGKKILTSKWIFKIKDDGRFKARLVVRGCQQKYGFDYEETFSPVVNTSSLRMMLAFASKNNFQIKKFDIKTAFLYGELLQDEKVYMSLPEGYEENNKVCLLIKSLYGLKQAPLRWNQHFSNFLKNNGLSSLKVEQCIFKNETGTLLLAIYVDDGLIIGKDEKEINNLLDGLTQKFEMVKTEIVNSFLNIEICQTDDGIKISQKNYIETMLEKFFMSQAKPANIPMVPNNTNNKTNLTNNKYPYREVIGSLLYLSNKTRPDISYAVNYGSRKIENPTEIDVTNVKQIMRYLISHINEGVHYKRNSNAELIAYSDSDFAGDTETRKSTTGYVIYFCGGPVSWCSRKQPIVAVSSTEAEYIAAAECVKELLYVKALADEMVGSSVNTILKIDNQSAIKIIKNGQFNRRSKHIDVRFHFINEKISDGSIKLEYCASEDQIADAFTKPLGNCKFSKHIKALVQ